MPLGAYPTVSLAEARLKREQAKLELQAGRHPDPGKAATPRSGDPRRLFRSVAKEWFDARKRPVLDERTAGRQWARLRGVFGKLGDLDVGEVRPADVLEALRGIEARGAVYTARRVRGMLESVFDFAAIPYGVESNPAGARLLQSLRPVPAARNQPALPFDRLPWFYAKLRGERCLQAQDDTRTRLAVELILHTVLRTHELRFGRWAEIRGDEWHIPAARMKEVNGVQRNHIVPLTPRAQEILRELKPFAHASEMIFPGLRPGRPMSENTMGNWIKARGYQDVATIHGFRTTFSSHMHESGLFDSAWIEMQLAHVDRNKVRGVYNKAQYLEQRRAMMTWWGEELARQESIGELL
jgi:integrase